jgi:hypothetical protein
MPEFDDEFYGFPEIPFHIHLGMRFTRPDPDGEAIVTLPASAAVTGPERRQSMCAVYTTAEVAGGIAMCDGLSLRDVAELDPSFVPLALTRRARFRPGEEAIGDLTSHCRFATDADEARERLRTKRKVSVAVEVEVRDERGALAGTMLAHYYVRVMSRSNLEAMAGTLTPTMAGGATAA